MGKLQPITCALRITVTFICRLLFALNNYSICMTRQKNQWSAKIRGGGGGGMRPSAPPSPHLDPRLSMLGFLRKVFENKFTNRPRINTASTDDSQCTHLVSQHSVEKPREHRTLNQLKNHDSRSAPVMIFISGTSHFITLQDHTKYANKREILFSHSLTVKT